MLSRILTALLSSGLLAGVAVAETTVVNEQVQVRDAQTDLPKRGSTMGDVEKRYGAPVARHPTVGGAPHQPPITRWDYNGFVVVFERDRVIDAVVLGSAPPASAVPEAPAAAAPDAPAPAPAPAGNG